MRILFFLVLLFAIPALGIASSSSCTNLTDRYALMLPSSPCRISPFDGVVISGAVGWDFMTLTERRRNLVFVFPNGTWTSKGSGNGFFGQGSIGYGRTFACKFHAGGRLGFSRYSDSEGAILTPNFAVAEFFGLYTKKYGPFAELRLGVVPQDCWLIAFIFGAQAERHNFLGGPGQPNPYRNSTVWVWGPRFGVGVERALDHRVSLGFDYLTTFSTKIFPETFNGTTGDEEHRRVTAQSHRIALTFNFRL